MPLSGLDALQWLDLSYNRISELGIGLNGVAAGSILLNGNPLSCGSLEQYLSRKPEGVDLRFDTGCK
jgi:Leucine-rich repeat (LRR) protein